jgi:VanZ family protein
MGVIFVLSHQPSLPYPDDLDARLVSMAGHFTVFAVLAALIWWALGLGPWTGPRRAVLAVMVATLYGISDEWHQSFVPGRTPDVRDVLTDAAGAIVAMLLVRWLARWERFDAWNGDAETGDGRGVEAVRERASSTPSR